MLYYSTYHRARYLENAQDYFIYKAHKEAWWKINIVLGFPWRSHASVRLVDLIDFCQPGRIVKQPSADFICSFIYIESFTFSLKLTFSQHACTSQYPCVTAISCDLFCTQSLLLTCGVKRKKKTPTNFPLSHSPCCYGRQSAIILSNEI